MFNFKKNLGEKKKLKLATMSHMSQIKFEVFESRL